MVPGIYGFVPIMSAWMANNSEPYYRRATSIAVGFIAANSVGQFFPPQNLDRNRIVLAQGGILSTWSFPTREGPKYRKTTIMNLIL
jgi:hypothetical protein